MSVVTGGQDKVCQKAHFGIVRTYGRTGLIKWKDLHDCQPQSVIRSIASFRTNLEGMKEKMVQVAICVVLPAHKAGTQYWIFQHGFHCHRGLHNPNLPSKPLAKIFQQSIKQAFSLHPVTRLFGFSCVGIDLGMMITRPSILQS